MGLIGGAIRELGRADAESRQRTSTLKSPDQWLIDATATAPSSTGKTVDLQGAFALTAVYQAVQVIAGTIASLPLLTYQREQPSGKRRAPDHSLFDVLHRRPNREMTAFTFFEACVANQLLRGNAFAAIEPDRATGRPALWPLPAHQVTVTRPAKGADLVYIWQPDQASALAFMPRDILHVPALSMQGLVGRSPLTDAREAFGTGLALQEYGGKLFANDSRPGGVLRTDKPLSDSARQRLKDGWMKAHQGLSQAHKVAVLEEGLQWQQIGVNPEDAQFLQSREFTVREIARFFNLSPRKLGAKESSPRANVEQDAIDFVTHTIRPWLVRWEQAIDTQLFSESDRRRGFFGEFLVEGLLRGDAQTRADFYSRALNWGWMSRNEVRERENLNPDPDGDRFMVPVNVQPADSLSAPQPAVPFRSEGRSEAPVSTRAQQTRRRIAMSFRGLFEEKARLILRREKGKVTKASRKHFGRRDAASFDTFLRDFYENEHREFVRSEMEPLFRSFAEAVEVEAREEVQGEERVALGDVAGALAASFATRFTLANRNELLNLVAENESEAVENIRQRFDDWIEKTPGKVGMKEPIKSESFTSRRVYEQNGVTRLRWITFGEDCPMCTRLNGMIVGIERNFVDEGTELQGEDDPKTKIVPSGPISHPPLHLGCDCTIAPA